MNLMSTSFVGWITIRRGICGCLQKKYGKNAIDFVAKNTTKKNKLRLIPVRIFDMFGARDWVYY